jgi:hypothetical protein
MNKMTSAVATAALAVTAVAITAGTASAAPATPAPASHTDNTQLSMDLLPGVHYASDTATHSVTITSAFGSITQQGSQFAVQDAQGHVVAGKPVVAPTQVAPKTGQLVGTAAVKTVAAPLRNVDETADFNTDLAVAATQFGLATGLGAMVGGVTGIVLGCPLGAVTAGTLVLPLVLPASAAGCVVGAGVGGTLGPVIGGALLGIPVGIASAVQMYNSMHASGDIAAPMAAPAHAQAMVARAHA